VWYNEVDRGRASSASQGAGSEDRRGRIRHGRRRGRRCALDRSECCLCSFILAATRTVAKAAVRILRDFVLDIDVKKVFNVFFILVTFLRCLTFFLFLKNVGKVQSGK